MGNASQDKKFIGNIYDYDKLHEIKYKHNSLSNANFSEFQRRITDENPTCSYSNGDPCWGLLKNGSVEEWVCKCVNTNCRYFSKCRPNFVEDEYMMFSPDILQQDTYNYKALYEIQIYDPVLNNTEEAAAEKSYAVFPVQSKNENHEENIDVINILKEKIQNEEIYVQEPSILESENEEIHSIPTLNISEEISSYFVGKDEINNIFDKFSASTQSDKRTPLRLVLKGP